MCRSICSIYELYVVYVVYGEYVVYVEYVVVMCSIVALLTLRLGVVYLFTNLSSRITSLIC